MCGCSSTNLEATRDRFEIGDLTRTDVAQSEARLEIGRSTLATARGTLSSSEENYRRVIGRQPGQLSPPPPLPPLPQTPEEAVRIALASNPDILAIQRQARAAGFDVSVARAGRLPTVSTGVSGTYLNNLAGNGTNPLDRPGQSRVGHQHHSRRQCPDSAVPGRRSGSANSPGPGA